MKHTDSQATKDAVRCIRGIDAAELEKAWREGYTRGYDSGHNDAVSYQWGTAVSKHYRQREEDDEWNASEAKASINQLSDGGPKP